MSTGRGISRLHRVSAITKCATVPKVSNVPISRTLAVREPLTGVPISQKRSFWATRPCQSAGKTINQDVDEASVDEGDNDLEVELLLVQNAAIAKLEAELGKTLEQAVVEDQLAEKVLKGHYLEDAEEDSGDAIEDDAFVEEPEDNFLVQMRYEGSSTEEVVREARNAFGDFLPENALFDDELSLYRRLYGEPLIRSPEDVTKELDGDATPGNALFDQAGQQVTYQLESAEDIANAMKELEEADAEFEDQTHSITHLGQSGRAEAVAKALGGEVIDEDVEDEIFDPLEPEEEPDDVRAHPLTTLGRFRTFPSTTFFPKDTFVKPIQKIMRDYSNKHLRETCENRFGGKGLPDSAFTPRSGRGRQQVPIPLVAGQSSMTPMEANAFITTIMPPTYASILATLVETRKRLGSSWLTRLLAKEGGPRILDAGSGGVAALAWRDIVKAHWDSLHTSDRNPPPVPESKLVVLTGSDALRHRASALLENTTFVPRLADYVATRQTPTLDDDRPAQQRKHFDVIIASHSLFPLKEEWERRHHVENLWSQLSNDGGVLILIEKGVARGFEAIAAARSMLLERHIRAPEGDDTYYTATSPGGSHGQHHQKTEGMIVAPCTNHDRCPLYKVEGVSKGRKDICSFQQRYIRPPFLQTVLKAKERNHDDVDFSYIAVMKGDDLRNRSFTSWAHVSDPLSAPKLSSEAMQTQDSPASHIQKGFEHTDPHWSDSGPPPPTHALPRIIYEPLKRQGHVTMDLCTPQGEIRRWTIPRSFSRQAYRDARKARWGDLWALGAKTNIARNLRLGTAAKEMVRADGTKEYVGKPRSRKERLQMQAEQAVEAHEVQVAKEQEEEDQLMRMLDADSVAEAGEGDDSLIDPDTLLPRKNKRRNHSKVDGVRIGGKEATAKADKDPTAKAGKEDTVKGRSAAQQRQTSLLARRNSRSPGDDVAESDGIGHFDYIPGRYGSDDSLSDWGREIGEVELDDEARRGVLATGRRATERNTWRFKKQLRRARRENNQM